MVTTVRAGASSVALIAAGLVLTPFGLLAQDECEFEPSNAASNAAQALQSIAEDATDVERNAKYTEALGFLAEEADGDNAVVFLFLAQANLGLQNFEEAHAALERYDEVAAPECLQYGQDQRYNGWVQLYNAGVSAYSASDNQVALDAFALANRFKPDLRSYTNAALLQSQLGDTEGAIATYREALAADIPDADPEQLRTTVRGLGDMLTAAGRSDEAMAAYEGYLANNPDDVVIRIRYAGSLAEQGQAEQSQAIYSEILARTDLGPQQWIEVGVGLYNAENFGDAATAFGNARAGNPYSKEAMENFVNASVQANRPGPVLALADTLVNWYPYDANNYQLLASALAQADMNDRAMEIVGAGETTDLIFHFAQMGSGGDGVYVVQGSFEPRTATGDVQIPFEFLDASGQVVMTEILTTSATAGSFRLEIQSGVPIAGFRYRKTSG